MAKVLFPGLFPFCSFPEGNTTPSRSIGETMHEYWIAKTWNVRLYYSDNGSIPAAEPFYDFYFGLAADTEKDIVCAPPFVYKYGDITETQFQDSGFSYSPADSGTGAYIAGYFARFNESNGDQVSIGYLPPGSPQTSTISVQFMDQHRIYVPISILSQYSETPQNFYEYITGVDISITENWEYQ